MEELDKKYKKYLKLTEEAINKVKVNNKTGEDFLDMAKRYFSDAKHFYEKGDLITAFAAVVYAHAWLDAGARIKAFNVKNSRLFMVE